MIGQTFDRLTVLSQVDTELGGSLRWLCQCSCLRYVIARGASLRCGAHKSCGCLRREAARARAVARNRATRSAPEREP